MKKQLLLTIFITICTSTFAQNCKWKENKIDPISDTKFLKSSTISIRGEDKYNELGKPRIEINTELKSGIINLNVLCVRYSNLSLEKILNPIIILKMKDGTKYEMPSNDAFALRYISEVYATTFDLKWTLTKAQVTALGQSNIIAIRISYAGQETDFIPTEKNASELMRIFNCLSNEL